MLGGLGMGMLEVLGAAGLGMLVVPGGADLGVLQVQGSQGLLHAGEGQQRPLRFRLLLCTSR